MMINEEKTKVLFASVDSDFADVLLSFLMLPLGVIQKLLGKHYGEQAPTIGSLKSLHTGLQNLDSLYFCTETSKQMLLNPRSSGEDLFKELKLNIYGKRKSIYSCCRKCQFEDCVVSLYLNSRTCTCGKRRIEVTTMNVDSGRSGEVFTRKEVSFLISDDLRILPNVTGSIIQSLKTWGITDVSGTELKTVTVGFNEIMDLLKFSLFSETPLSDIFLHKGRIRQATSSTCFVPQVKKEEDRERMKITAMVQKSSHKVLFAQADNDFVDFLFSLLTIPLGQVENLVSMKSSLGCVDNFYRSVASFDGHKCLATEHTKDILLKPRLPPKYVSNNQIFHLAEQRNPWTHLYTEPFSYASYLSASGDDKITGLYCKGKASFVDPKGQGSYVNGNGMFMVTDDLTVTPLFRQSSLSTLTGLGIPLSDIEEIEVKIGLNEASNILKASLTSTSALTNGLNLTKGIQLIASPSKRPKRESII